MSHSRRSSRRVSKAKEPDELDKVLENCNEMKKTKCINVKELQDLKKQFKQTCDTTKREIQKLEQAKALKKRAGTTRSGAKRGFVKKPVYTDGKWVNRGIDDSKDHYDKAEKEYLERSLSRVKKVVELKYEHIKYLVIDVYLNDLKAIKQGELESHYHQKYKSLGGKTKMDLFSEVRTTLFTNEQRDYINGLLQGAFDTINKDDKGDIKHSDINYITIVLFAEIIIRIVKLVHKFESSEETLKFMLKSSRESLGLAGDSDDD